MCYVDLLRFYEAAVYFLKFPLPQGEGEGEGVDISGKARDSLHSDLFPPAGEGGNSYLRLGYDSLSGLITRDQI